MVMEIWMGQEMCFAFLSLVAFVKEEQEGKTLTDGTERLCLHLQNCLLPLGLPLSCTCQSMGGAPHPHMDTLSYSRR